MIKLSLFKFKIINILNILTYLIIDNYNYNNEYQIKY